VKCIENRNVFLRYFISISGKRISQKFFEAISRIEKSEMHNFVTRKKIKTEEGRAKIVKALYTLDLDLELKNRIFDILEPSWFVREASPRRHLELPTSATPEVDEWKNQLSEKDRHIEMLEKKLEDALAEVENLKSQLKERDDLVGILNRSVDHHRRLELLQFEKKEPPKPQPKEKPAPKPHWKP
jgi:hypothetical protein